MPLPAGRYRLRVVVLTRTLAAQAANGEEAETFSDPAAGTNEYFAAVEALSGGEQILQGLRQSTGGMRLRIKGESIAVAASDRVKKKGTGEVFAVTGLWRNDGETVLNVERVAQQTTGQ
jgi:head-tail adaptor